MEAFLDAMEVVSDISLQCFPCSRHLLGCLIAETVVDHGNIIHDCNQVA